MKKITLIAFVLAGSSIAFMLYGFISKPKVAFVHVQEVYNEFEYKKELETKYEKVQSERKRILDSLEIQINAIATNIQNSEVNKEKNIQNYQYLVADYQSKKKAFSEDNAMVSEKYTQQIWNQLNQYVEEYGKQKGFDFIYGADGSGNVMYAEKGFNITEQIKEYVNQRYLGGTGNEK